MSPKTLLLASLIVVAGCGGSGSSSSASPAPAEGGFGVLTVEWPSRTRMIPAAANSLVVVLERDGREVATKTISRPEAGGTTTQTKFEGLAYGDYTLEVSAYPTTDGVRTKPTTVAQAVGTGGMSVSEDVPGSAEVSLASTVTRILVASATVSKGQTVNLRASARDANNAIVLLSAGGGEERVDWSSDNPAIADVSGSGPEATLRGVHSGNAKVTAELCGTNGAKLATTTASIKVNAVDDGEGTVIVR